MGLEGTSSDDFGFGFGFGKNNDKYKDLTEGQEPVVTIPEATETILRRHSFVTLKENDLIYVYKDGVYVPEGEVVMKQVLEELFGYQLNRRKHAEIREHIRNKTYKSIDEFDADLNIIDMDNGLYNIQTGELMPILPVIFH